MNFVAVYIRVYTMEQIVYIYIFASLRARVYGCGYMNIHEYLTIRCVCKYEYVYITVKHFVNINMYASAWSCIFLVLFVQLYI